MSQKIRQLFIPFLIISLAFIGIYSLLNWFFCIRNPLLTPKEEYVEFWGPAILAWIPVLIWIRPRLRLLNMKSKKGDRTFGFLFVAAIMIAIPTGFLQNYLKLATGKLTVLNSVGQIDKKHITKYYDIKHYYVAKEYQSR